MIPYWKLDRVLSKLKKRWSFQRLVKTYNQSSQWYTHSTKTILNKLWDNCIKFIKAQIICNKWSNKLLLDMERQIKFNLRWLLQIKKMMRAYWERRKIQNNQFYIKIKMFSLNLLWIRNNTMNKDNRMMRCQKNWKKPSRMICIKIFRAIPKRNSNLRLFKFMVIVRINNKNPKKSELNAL